MIMKKNLFFAAAALAALTLSSCTVDDNSFAPEPTYEVISFENQDLTADGYWCGDETGTKTLLWDVVEAYSCAFAEKSATSYTTWMPEYQSWSGYAISNRTATNFDVLFPDQFNSCVGKAYEGNNYCVIYPQGEAITFEGGAVVKGFYYTNSAYVVKCILEGDGMSPGKFEAEDWFKCTVTATTVDDKEVTAEIMLAENGDYVKDWQFVDLSSLGKVICLRFSFESTKKNDWGPTTPTYMCIDNIILEK